MKLILSCFQFRKLRNLLHLIVCKPHRFLNVRPGERNEVEAKGLFKINRNGIDSSDRPSKPSKGTITGHPYATVYQEQVIPHATLVSSARSSCRPGHSRWPAYT